VIVYARVGVQARERVRSVGSRIRSIAGRRIVWKRDKNLRLAGNMLTDYHGLANLESGVLGFSFWRPETFFWLDDVHLSQSLMIRLKSYSPKPEMMTRPLISPRQRMDREGTARCWRTYAVQRD
jgi:hypothetical protein